MGGKPVMTSNIRNTFQSIQVLLQLIAMGTFALAACGAVGATVLAGVGWLPWLTFPISFGDQVIPASAIQIGVTVFLVLLCSFVPSAVRVMRLEATHRDFSLRMEDVARAYWTAHAADREGVFTLKREYDAVRERLMFLRSHPDLEDLDRDLLEVAAQMSHETRELADIYSDANVARAREILEHRRHEAEVLSERIDFAHRETGEIRRMLEDVRIDEDIVKSRIERLREELGDLFPALGQPVEESASARRARIGVVPGS